MAVTLDGIDIETVIDIFEKQAPRISLTPLGIHSLQLAQNMKSTVHEFQVTTVWSGGSTDFNAKKRHLQNIADSGLPVWLDASDWATNQIMFGKVHDIETRLSDGKPNVYDVVFMITAVFPWGYIFIQDDGAGDYRMYDLDKRVQSRTVNPILRRCTYTKSAVFPGSITYSIYVKNVGASSGQVIIELMVPDDVTTGSITTNVVTTKAQGTVGTSGMSTTPGSKNRVTLKRTLGAGIEEQWNVTITINSAKTSFYDGSIDDTAA